MSRVEELIALCQAGDADAKETMIAENSGLIWSVTRRFLGRGAELSIGKFMARFVARQHVPRSDVFKNVHKFRSFLKEAML